MAKTYKGVFKPRNKSKYRGDAQKIVYRSLWERQVFRWCDNNKSVVEWSSEEVVVPYISPVDNRMHRYFVDIYIKLADGNQYLIEIKPEKQTKPPTSKKKTKLLTESITFAQNNAKWDAARKFADLHGMHFEIWTEKTLKALGIKILTK